MIMHTQESWSDTRFERPASTRATLAATVGASRTPARCARQCCSVNVLVLCTSSPAHSASVTFHACCHLLTGMQHPLVSRLD